MQDFPIRLIQTQKTLQTELVHGSFTACLISYEEVLFVLLSNDGKLGQLISLANESSTISTTAIGDDSEEFAMLPDLELTPAWLLGANDSFRADLAGLLSVQITSALRRRGLKKKVLFGLGIRRPDQSSFSQNGDIDEEQNSMQAQLISLALETYESLEGRT